MKSKTLLLEKIKKEIETCRICKKQKSGKAVVGEGNSNADIVFIGEAPGREEAKTGRPFVGRSGKLLRLLITDIGLQEKDAYITSPVKYLPDRGTPSTSDIEHGKTHLLKQLAVINPKVIVLLGRVGATALLEKPVFVLKDHGTVIEKGGGKYFITLHPAAAIRFQKLKAVLQSDFKKLKKLVGVLK